MKVLSILLALVNSLLSGVVLFSSISVSKLGWNGLGWLAARITVSVLVIIAGILTFRDGTQTNGQGKMLAVGLMLVLLGTVSLMWGVHLSIISRDVKNVMVLFGGSLMLQGIASVIGLQEPTDVAV